MDKVNVKKISTYKGPEKSPGFLLWQVSIKWRRLLEQTLKKFDLTHPQFVVLASLGWLTQNKDFVTQIDIARFAGLDPNTLSQILRGLEKKHFIKRKTRSIDERSKFPILTQQGASTLKKALPAIERADEEFFSKLNKQDTQFIIKVFHKLSE